MKYSVLDTARSGISNSNPRSTWISVTHREPTIYIKVSIEFDYLVIIILESLKSPRIIRIPQLMIR